MQLSNPRDGGRSALVTSGATVVIQEPGTDLPPFYGRIVQRTRWGLVVQIEYDSSLDTVIALAGGKGSVGRSFLALNIAYELANLDKKVTLVDGDLTGGHLHRLLGIDAIAHLGDLSCGELKVEEVLTSAAGGLFLIPGLPVPTEPTGLGLSRLRTELGRLENSMDYLIVDTSPTSYHGTFELMKLAGVVVLVSTLEPHAIVDIYAAAKTLKENNRKTGLHLLLNQVDSHGEASKAAEKICFVIQDVIDYPIDYLGAVRFDKRVRKAAYQQVPLGMVAPGSPARRDILNLVRKWLRKE
ncbi:MAG: P-loop NTPase [Limnochordia bacterium]|nr:P-loop NTPase [Limnochordia bacterium]MDD4518115.1 P-loop NTPase [Limnochordia bacterium]